MLLTLCLLPVCAVAEEQDFLTVTVGHVLVPMTALPVCLKESNLDGVCTDSCQLYGNCARDGNEFCVRTATITGLISQLGEQYPWGSGKENRMNAAVNYAAFYVVAAYGGKVTVEHAWADEATGNLDTRTSFEILVLFQKLHAAGRTIIFVTHNPDIANYSSRNIMLRDGHVISDEYNHNIQSAAEGLAALPANSDE